MLNGKPYRYVGANYFYGPILGAPHKGDRARLKADLDSLQALGIDNLRVCVGADGPDPSQSKISPSLQTAPGVYDPDMLQGLDYFLAELERRDMRAVLYLTNAWEWSGGYGMYLQWSGQVPAAPVPAAIGYPKYTRQVAMFLSDAKALEMFANHVRAIVGRTSSINGKPYAASPAIMSWQVANEPRAFSAEAKTLLKQWIHATAALIKSIDTNHLVSTGSEGSVGCERDLELWTEIHADPLIDYANIHIWPYNFGWVNDEHLQRGLRGVLELTDWYIGAHAYAIAPYHKPLVLEEFGYPRDGHSFSHLSSTTCRDRFYSHIFAVLLRKHSPLQGVNFWGWTGTAIPVHQVWQPGDPFTGDPAHEPQGFYGVYSHDTTVPLIRQAALQLEQ